MKKKKQSSLGLVAFGVLWLGAFAAGGYVLFQEISPSAHQIKPAGYHEEMSTVRRDSLGDQRMTRLMAATKQYVADHPEVGEAMRAGRELAPADFLNEELKREGAKWRVRDVRGLSAKIYDVS